MNPRPDHSTFVTLFTSDLQHSGKPAIFNFPCLTQTYMMSKIPPSPPSHLSLLSPHLHPPRLPPPRRPVTVRGLLTEVHIPAGWHHHLREIMKIEAGLQVGIMQQPRIPGESKTILSISPQFWPKLELGEFHSFSVVGNVPHPETLVNPIWDVLLSVKEKPRRILGIRHSPTAHSNGSKRDVALLETEHRRLPRLTDVWKKFWLFPQNSKFNLKITLSDFNLRKVFKNSVKIWKYVCGWNIFSF